MHMSQSNDQLDATETFVQAVRSGAHDELRTLLANATTHKAFINLPLFDFNAPALVYAAMYADRALLELLLEAGADINAKSAWWAGGFGVLHFATGDVAEWLIERGAQLDAHAAAHLNKPDALKAMIAAHPAVVATRGGDGKYPLHFAASPTIVDILLDHGADLDARDIDHGSTAAQYAAGSRPNVCRRLIDHGAHTDIFMAIALDDEQLARTILASDPDALHARTGRGHFIAPGSQGGHIYTFMSTPNATPLHTAAVFNRSTIAELLVDAGLDVNIVGGYDDCTPLHLSAWNNTCGVAAALLERGAQLETESGARHENTPLGWAIVAGAYAMVEFLLQRGAQIRPYYVPHARHGQNGGFREYTDIDAAGYAAIAELLETAQRGG